MKNQAATENHLKTMRSATMQKNPDDCYDVSA